MVKTSAQGFGEDVRQAKELQRNLKIRLKEKTLKTPWRD